MDDERKRREGEREGRQTEKLEAIREPTRRYKIGPVSIWTLRSELPRTRNFLHIGYALCTPFHMLTPDLCIDCDGEPWAGAGLKLKQTSGPKSWSLYDSMN